MCKPTTSSCTEHQLKGQTSISETLLKDLEISSSDSDPFAGDDEDKDPDFDVSTFETSQRKILHQTNNLDYRDASSESSVELNEPKEKATRKRCKNEHEWKRNKIKKLRNSGKPYTNWRGNSRPERALKSSCEKCRLKCPEKVSIEQRNEIFKNFWGMEDINRQRDYISKYVLYNIKVRNRQRKETSPESEVKSSRRNFTFVYFLPTETKVKVCKTFFLNTLSISAQTVRTVFNKVGSAGTVMEDKRGKACKNSQLDNVVHQSVRDHINKFETIKSHYCRQKTSRLYLPATLSIAKMYTLYQEYCLENNIQLQATESMYRSIFNTQFNMAFSQPKKDLCDTCHRYDNANVEEKLEIEESYREHIENKYLARNLKNSDKEKAKQSSAFCAAVFDLQQVLTTPKTEVGIAYYKQKLSTYNFTIYNLASRDACCYMWYECIGKRGSSEVGSCLLLFIEKHVQKGIKEFSFYSDNCPGQNRNKFLMSFYNYAAQRYNVTVKHTFLERGHTQSEADSVHSVIEKAARNIPVYSPEQWYTVVRTSKRKQPYVVVELAQENIIDLKDLQQKTTINCDRDEENEKIYWNQVKSVKANASFPNIMFIKDTYKEDAPWKQINLLKKGRKSINTIDIKNFNLKQLYKESIPLTKLKYDHLQYLCEKKAILSQYHCFYQNLPYTAQRQQSKFNNDSDDEH